MGAYEVNIACILLEWVRTFARARQMGRGVMEMLFRLPISQKQRRPDVAFVSYQLWPNNRPIPQTEAWDVVPELAVEIVSPSNTADEIQTKLQEYFRDGVKLASVVYPRQFQVYVYQSPTMVRILTRSDEIDGGEVLPDFRLPVASLFEEDPA